MTFDLFINLISQILEENISGLHQSITLNKSDVLYKQCTEKALSYVQEILDKPNHPQRKHALHLYGYMFEKGVGVNVDVKKAKEYLEQSAQLGNPHSMVSRAQIDIQLYSQKGNSINYEPTKKWLSDAIDLNYALARLLLARLYKNGMSGISDPTGADRMQAAIEGDISQSFKSLSNSVAILRGYGTQIALTNKEKSSAIETLSQDLMKQIKEYSTHRFDKNFSTNDTIQFLKTFQTRLHREDELMQTHSTTWKVIVANILLALTGVGFIAIIGKAIYSSITAEKGTRLQHSFFGAKTQTHLKIDRVQEMLDMTRKEMIPETTVQGPMR